MLDLKNNHKLVKIKKDHDELISRKNIAVNKSNGIFQRYTYPILTANHTPLHWRYDFNADKNPYMVERFGINAVLNAGAIKLNNKYLVVARVEGLDRKSFFAVAESSNGIDNFRFWDYPVILPDTNEPDTNIYDMRLVHHDDNRMLQHSIGSWAFIQQKILDKHNGEWVWGIQEDYSVMKGEDKAGFWKCPYHNGRACIEIVRRIKQ